MEAPRRSSVQRATGETRVAVTLVLDGRGALSVRSPGRVFNHLLSSLFRFSRFDAGVEAEQVVEVDEHHIVEDVAVSLGQALDRALGERAGIERFGFAVTPMDECLVLSSVDMSGRGRCFERLRFRVERIGDLPTPLIPHFFHSLALNGRFTLHLKVLRGGDDHHLAEALFKSAGLSLGQAASLTGAREVPSTKGVL